MAAGEARAVKADLSGTKPDHGWRGCLRLAGSSYPDLLMPKLSFIIACIGQEQGYFPATGMWQVGFPN
jgi:hypothetical protein